MLNDYTMSHHMRADRVDRLTKIAITIGFGEIIKEAPIRGAVGMFSDTGVLYIVNKKKKLIITAYVATVDEAVAFYGGRLPPKIFAVVRKNEQKNWDF